MKPSEATVRAAESCALDFIKTGFSIITGVSQVRRPDPQATYDTMRALRTKRHTTIIEIAAACSELRNQFGESAGTWEHSSSNLVVNGREFKIRVSRSVLASMYWTFNVYALRTYPGKRNRRTHPYRRVLDVSMNVNLTKKSELSSAGLCIRTESDFFGSRSVTLTDEGLTLANYETLSQRRLWEERVPLRVHIPRQFVLNTDFVNDTQSSERVLQQEWAIVGERSFNNAMDYVDKKRKQYNQPPLTYPEIFANRIQYM